ncbi:MAG: hypothetical protein P4L76_07655 [Beijerinckiaceae bacterium]|nr:hypothetical protein [Beijerinckiaceae bacterium]
MLRLIFRLSGFLLLAGAFAALIVDGTRSIAVGALAPMPLEQLASNAFPDLFLKAQAAVQAHLPFLWAPVVEPLLKSPIWLVTGILGIVLIALARPPQPKIGYSRR